MLAKIRAWFHDSETILWARLQMAASVVVSVIAVLDPALFSQYVSAHWVPVYLLVSGIITEIARRLRENGF